MNQQTALSILKSGHNIYLTGSAGTGKTYLINEYVNYLREREVPVAVTASTGIAATHIGGQTVHSWSGIGIKDQIFPRDLEKIGSNKQRKDRLEQVEVLVIDEISMLSGQVLTGISDILKHFKKSHLPFGGVQVILSGDFFQLPPVSRDKLSNREKFAFMAPIWVEANLKICYLTDQYRQGEDTLSRILSEIRGKELSEETQFLIQDKLLEEMPDSDIIKLYTHNADVDEMNAERLKENPNPPKTFEAKTKGNSRLVDTLKQTVLAAPALELKKGAKVMFVRNNPEKGYFNGSTGTVEDFDAKGWPKVKLSSGQHILTLPEEWTVVDEKENILASYEQIPLRLAWAITVHKSQGMTLDAAEIDLSKTFETGQGYVALSRLKDWNGLYLKGMNNRALMVDDLAFKADRRFQELSSDYEQQIQEIPEAHLKIAFEKFIEKCGGTNDPDIIENNKSRVREFLKKPAKESTYQKTRKLIEEGKSLDLIAFERDLSFGTIIGHLERIKNDHPELDLSDYQPDRKSMEKVEKAMSKLKGQGNEEFYDKEGRLKIGFIHSALNGKVDYDEIRLARLFLLEVK
ncbi:AAA family ATPase [Marinoscillum sp. MHG1-6]|uniref:AAA family ATPase n=1 Tax=Marinoscillum sp. MHG1-6 TaxID=2959627 RepID=UPI00215874FC|nr:AAA family ATPase [Marinoscillum sp. MHG1-6]